MKTLDKMTDKELNQAIVEMTGGCWHVGINGKSLIDDICVKCKRHDGRVRYIGKNDNPKYCSSRDLCAEVIKEMDETQRRIFSSNLAILADIIGLTIYDTKIYSMTADPRLWAEAVYGTLKEL